MRNKYAIGAGVFFLILGLFFAIVTLTFPNERTTFFPLTVGVLMAALSAWQLPQDLRATYQKFPAKVVNPLRIMVWILALVIGIQYVHYLILIPVFIFSILMVEGKSSIKEALAASVSMFVFVFIMFQLLLKVSF